MRRPSTRRRRARPERPLGAVGREMPVDGHKQLGCPSGSCGRRRAPWGSSNAQDGHKERSRRARGHYPDARAGVDERRPPVADEAVEVILLYPPGTSPLKRKISELEAQVSRLACGCHHPPARARRRSTEVHGRPVTNPQTTQMVTG